MINFYFIAAHKRAALP